jgi:hypothetical protein
MNEWIADPFTFEGAVLWLGALATLALYTVLYRENPIYRFAEHVFLGLAIGYGAYVTWRDILFPKWYTPLFTEHHWPWIFAFVAGAMYYTIYSKRFSWMSRVVMMTMMGLSAGLTFRQFFGEYYPQIGASFKPLVVIQKTPVDMGGSAFASFTNILFLVCLLAVSIYFLFSFEQRNPAIRKTANVGRWLMMVAFGAMFGSTVMARMSLFIGRLDFLFRDWLHLIR